MRPRCPGETSPAAMFSFFRLFNVALSCRLAYVCKTGSLVNSFLNSKEFFPFDMRHFFPSLPPGCQWKYDETEQQTNVVIMLFIIIENSCSQDEKEQQTNLVIILFIIIENSFSQDVKEQETNPVIILIIIIGNSFSPDLACSWATHRVLPMQQLLTLCLSRRSWLRLVVYCCCCFVVFVLLLLFLLYFFVVFVLLLFCCLCFCCCFVVFVLLSLFFVVGLLLLLFCCC